jgi:hypothetical protein
VRVSDDGQGEYEVVAILGKKEELEDPPPPSADEPSSSIVAGRRRAKKVMVTRYLVQWAGYSMDDCSWEPAVNLAGAPDLVVDYERRLAAEATGCPSVMMLGVGTRM